MLYGNIYLSIALAFYFFYLVFYFFSFSIAFFQNGTLEQPWWWNVSFEGQASSDSMTEVNARDWLMEKVVFAIPPLELWDEEAFLQYLNYAFLLFFIQSRVSTFVPVDNLVQPWFVEKIVHLCSASLEIPYVAMVGHFNILLIRQCFLIQVFYWRVGIYPFFKFIPFWTKRSLLHRINSTVAVSVQMVPLLN